MLDLVGNPNCWISHTKGKLTVENTRKWLTQPKLVGGFVIKPLSLHSLIFFLMFLANLSEIFGKDKLANLSNSTQ